MIRDEVLRWEEERRRCHLFSTRWRLISALIRHLETAMEELERAEELRERLEVEDVAEGR